MQTVTKTITKREAALLTAAALGMAGSIPLEQGRDIVISALKNYVRPMSSHVWGFLGVEVYLCDALSALAYGNKDDFWNNVDDAKDKCMSILKATE